jgi:signal transduction histidine kinase
VATVTLDPWRGYASALVAPLGHARVVVDHFHAIKLANTVVDQVRRRTQQATLGHRGRKPDPLYRIRKLLLTAHEQLTSRGRERLRAGLAAGDPGGEVVAAWQGKEPLRAVYAVSDLAHARAALERFYRWCDGVQIPELSRVARTVRAWEAEILAFHTTGGCSNGPTEAMNLLIKKVKRVGRGFRNFTNYRLRLLLHCGVRWPTHRTIPTAVDELGDTGKNVAIRVPDELPEVRADPALLERALVNVLTNALRYSPLRRPPMVTAREDGGQVEIRVVDHGPGVPAADWDRIFAPFQRLGDRDNATGVGLGLALSRGLVEATGGTLTPDTTPGGGLTMIFQLPAAEPAEDGPDQAADPALLDHIEHWRVDDGRGART